MIHVLTGMLRVGPLKVPAGSTITIPRDGGGLVGPRAEPFGSALGSVDSLPVGLMPGWKDCCHAEAFSGGVPSCAIKDACSGRIVGYSMDARMTSALAVTALRNAIARRAPADTVVHSDRGSQFRSHAYVHELRAAGLIGSMGPGRRLRGQRGDGIVLLAAAKERSGSTSLGNPRPATDRDHHLDRTDLPPPTAPRPSRQTHPYRVRDPQPGRSRGLTTPTQTSQLK